MKGNGRIIVFFSVLLVLIGLIILNVTLFTIKNITVLEKVASELIVKEDIISSSRIEVGNNIFALSEKKAIKNIELANPYIGVTSIERKFPNKVVIHVTVRTPIMSIGINNLDSFALLDADLKVLDIVESYSRTYQASTKIEGLIAQSPVIGATLNTDNPLNYALATIGVVADNENLSEVAFLTFFHSINFLSDTQSNNIHIRINSGVTFVLTNNNSLEEQLRYCLEKYKLTDELSLERKSGYYYFDRKEGWLWSKLLPDN